MTKDLSSSKDLSLNRVLTTIRSRCTLSDMDGRWSRTGDQCVIDIAHTIVLHNSPSIMPFEGGLSCSSGSSLLAMHEDVEQDF